MERVFNYGNRQQC